MEQNKLVKPLPYTPKKGKIYEMYQKQLGSTTLREKLNELMELGCNQAGVPFKKGMSFVSRKVWVEWLKIFGFPENYEQKEEWLNEESLT